MKKIEYIEINGYLYPKLALPPQKEIHLTRFGKKKIAVFKAVSTNCLYESINKW